MTEQKQDIAELIRAKREASARLFNEALELECAEKIQEFKDAVAAYAERVATSGVSKEEGNDLSRLHMLRSDLRAAMDGLAYSARYHS